MGKQSEDERREEGLIFKVMPMQTNGEEGVLKACLLYTSVIH